MGNVVKGWDIDAKPFVGRPKIIEDKEKIFSQSSYSNWIGNVNSSKIANFETDDNMKRKLDAGGGLVSKPLKKMKKMKSSSKLIDDVWDPDF